MSNGFKKSMRNILKKLSDVFWSMMFPSVTVQKWSHIYKDWMDINTFYTIGGAMKFINKRIFQWKPRSTNWRIIAPGHAWIYIRSSHLR